MIFLLDPIILSTFANYKYYFLNNGQKKGILGIISNSCVDAIIQNGVLTIVTHYVIEQYDYVADRTTGKKIRGESKYKMRVNYEMRFRQSINNNRILNCFLKLFQQL